MWSSALRWASAISAHGVGDGGVLLHPPVVDLQIIVHQVLIVEHGGIQIADLLPLLTVQDIGLGHVGVARLAEDGLHAVLNVLHGDAAVLDLGLKVGGHPQGQHVDHTGVILLVQGLKSLGDGGADLADFKWRGRAVPFCYLVHHKFLPVSVTSAAVSLPVAASSTIAPRFGPVNI